MTMVMPVVVIGAGPARLSVSRELTALDIDHVVLERTRVAQACRNAIPPGNTS